MKPSPTTFYGGAAAVCFAAGNVPTLPGWMITAFNIGAAVSMALLGKHSADCPANCPGTDQHGKPRPASAVLRIPVTLAAIVASTVMLLCGCVAPNPAAGPDNPSAPAFIVDPAMNQASNAAVAMSREIGDLTQTGPLLPMAVTGFFTTAAAIAGLVAQHRSHRRALANSTGRSSTPANTPVDEPPPRA